MPSLREDTTSTRVREAAVSCGSCTTTSTPAPPAARQELGWRRSSWYGLLAYAPPISSQAAGAGNTVERHLYGSWKLIPQASLARPDGKCRKRARAPILPPGVEACGPVSSVRWLALVVYFLTRLHARDHGKYHVNSHSCARTLCHIRLTSLTTHVMANHVGKDNFARMWCIEAHVERIRILY